MKIRDERKNPHTDTVQIEHNGGKFNFAQASIQCDGNTLDITQGTIYSGEKLEIRKGHPHELFLVDDKPTDGDSNDL